ncbi:MAG TPA: S26 family signal peptidase, partial [Ktedonobacterales bacterium]|nr:S26 family signal peptidase [Ktedonobacterales bacterium]
MSIGIVLVLVIVVAVLAATVRPIGQVVQVATGQQLRVNGPSMEPTIRNGQTIYVRTYLGSAPARGDIVVYHPASNPQEEYVKRVVA